MTGIDSNAEVRKMSAGQLEDLGRQSLREHLLAQAIVAIRSGRPLEASCLDALLKDPECLLRDKLRKNCNSSTTSAR